MSYGAGLVIGGQQMSCSIKPSDLMNTPAAAAARDRGEIEMMLDAGFDQLKRLHATIDLTPVQASAPVAESTSCVLSSRLHEVNVGLMQANDRLLSILDRCHL